MTKHTRRDFLAMGAIGLATGAGALVLRADAQPTPQSGDIGDYGDYLRRTATDEAGEARPAPDAGPKVEPAGRWAPTEDNILGPFYRQDAPFRGKITPPLEPGEVLLIRGRVWGHDTKKPLASAVLDIWQANASGRYDNDDPRNPPKNGVFENRARLVTDAEGYYEYETIHPGHYRIAPDQWRPAHIHYMVRHGGYQTLVTQLYFKGDRFNDGDPFIKPSLIVALQPVTTPHGDYHTGVFDIVLAPR